MIRIAGRRALSDRLARLDIIAVQQTAMEAAALRLRAAVEETLSIPPGGSHTAPWKRTGSLRNSIDHQSDATSAVVGSPSSLAIYQELGTGGIPPRPFLSPTGSNQASALANDLAQAITAALLTAAKDAGS